MMWKWWHTAAVIVFIVLVAGLSALATQLGLTKSNHLGLWFMVVLGVLVLLLLVVVGWGIVGRPDGILIDSRNRVTLSNFQLVVWTLVLVTAYGGAFLTNLLAGADPVDALNISVPPELWAVLGVSGASYVTAKTIRAGQGKSTTGPQAAAVTGMTEKGRLIVRDDAAKANWGDMFTSDLASDALHTDISKVQMFSFTVLLATGYTAAVVNLLVNASSPVTQLPALNSAVVIVLVVSHGGYLGRKAAGNLS